MEQFIETLDKNFNKNLNKSCVIFYALGFYGSYTVLWYSEEYVTLSQGWKNSSGLTRAQTEQKY